MDFFVLALLLTSFATLVLAHVTLVMALVARRPRWKGWLALVALPLAPFWGYEAKLRKLVALWLVSLVIYLFALMASAV